MSAREDVIAGRYRLISQVGAGGMGVVWEAWDERLERRVAAKQLRVPPGLSEVEAELATQRAMREARITAQLHHRYAVSVFDVVDDDGQPCLIMPFVPSVTLAAVLREGGPLQVHEAAQVGAEVASALSAAHRLGIVHRDVKPGNILIADDGSALISDFGISRALGDATLTSTGLVHGTPAYLPPEVARGEEADFASDVFSLGATLYAALEGAPPFGTDTNSLALLHRVAAGKFEPPRQAGPLTPVLLRMLSREPSARPPMRVVASTLAGLTSSEVTGGSIPAPVAAESPPVQLVPPPPVVASAGPDWSLTGEAARKSANCRCRRPNGADGPRCGQSPSPRWSRWACWSLCSGSRDWAGRVPGPSFSHPAIQGQPQLFSPGPQSAANGERATDVRAAVNGQRATDLEKRLSACAGASSFRLARSHPG